MSTMSRPYHRGMHRADADDKRGGDDGTRMRPTVLIGDSKSADDLRMMRQLFFGEPLPFSARSAAPSTADGATYSSRQRQRPPATAAPRLKGDRGWVLSDRSADEGARVRCAGCGATFFVRGGAGATSSVAQRGVCGTCSARGARHGAHDGSGAMRGADVRWQSTLHAERPRELQFDEPSIGSVSRGRPRSRFKRPGEGGGGYASSAASFLSSAHIAPSSSPLPLSVLWRARLERPTNPYHALSTPALASFSEFEPAFDSVLDRQRVGFVDRGKARFNPNAPPSHTARGWSRAATVGTARSAGGGFGDLCATPPWVAGEPAGGPSGGGMVAFEDFRDGLALTRAVERAGASAERAAAAIEASKRAEEAPRGGERRRRGADGGDGGANRVRCGENAGGERHGADGDESRRRRDARPPTTPSEVPREERGSAPPRRARGDGSSSAADSNVTSGRRGSRAAAVAPPAASHTRIGGPSASTAAAVLSSRPRPPHAVSSRATMVATPAAPGSTPSKTTRDVRWEMRRQQFQRAALGEGGTDGR